MKHSNINPISLAELREKIPVVGRTELIKTGYILDVNGSGEIELSYYKNCEEVEDEKITIDFLVYETFDDFTKQVKEYTEKKKLYISIDYALVLLAVLNGGMPEDYEED